MAKKATLDILDIKIDEVQKEEPADDLAPETGVGDISGQPLRRLLALLGQWCRSRLFGFLLLGAALLITAAAALVFLLHEGPPSKASVVPPKASAAGAATAAASKTILLPGFVVDLKDDRGLSRVIFCDVALDLERLQKGEAAGGWVESRNLIHAMLKRKKVRELLLPEDRKRLKIELKDQLNALLGENSIREVYFTRFEIF
jgi:flagellar protein FliL